MIGSITLPEWWCWSWCVAVLLLGFGVVLSCLAAVAGMVRDDATVVVERRAADEARARAEDEVGMVPGVCVSVLQ